MLDKKLLEYGRSGAYPFHMPGHKRVTISDFDPYKIDITEIPGFDDLHDAHGLIDDLQKGYAALYGAQDAYLSVNGSTLGNLAAIFAATDRGDEIIVADGCHRSVLHAAELNGLKVHTITPEAVEDNNSATALSGRVRAHQVKEALDKYQKTRLVVITHPGYEGVLSEIDEIVEISHERDVTVHIDGAHGAHHGLGGMWEKPIIASKADTAVLSLHKTLPAFTGSSVLLRSSGSRISKESIDHYMDCFETSSPSYILMYGMAVCLSYIKKGGKDLFDDYGKRVKDFYKQTEDLKNICVCRFDHHDMSKIIISGKGKYTGEEIAGMLRRDHNIETELTRDDYCLALSSVMDDQEAFDVLSSALFKIGNGL